MILPHFFLTKQHSYTQTKKLKSSTERCNLEKELDDFNNQKIMDGLPEIFSNVKPKQTSVVSSYLQRRNRVEKYHHDEYVQKAIHANIINKRHNSQQTYTSPQKTYADILSTGDNE